MPYKNIIQKQEFHREYMREYNKSHPLTEEQKKEKALKNKIWRDKNKEKLAEYQSQRWQRDKAKIVLRKKKHALENADLLKERRHEYYLKNLETFKEKTKLYYINNKEKTREHKKTYSRSPRGRFKAYQHNAFKKGREFTLTENEFYNLLIQQCHYCGDTSYGIDRKDSSKGYSVDNSLPCCSICNYMKRDNPYEDFIDRIKAITKHLTLT